MEEQKEIQKQFRHQQEKYTYYIIALCVAAVGFSVNKTIDVPLKLTQIPLGIAVLAWSASIYCGLKFLQFLLSILNANNDYFDIIEGYYPDIGKNPHKIKGATDGIKQAMESIREKASRFANWQYRLFLVGFISFIIWHLLEMYNNTICVV